MKTTFDTATDWVLVHEGGYVNHPDDPGGATNKGVTQATYNAYRRKQGQPFRSVREITIDEVYRIYRLQYWDKVWGDYLPLGMDYTMYDFAINSGPSRAVKFLQRRLGVAEDGIFGLITLEAVRKHPNPEQLIEQINFDRWNWMKTLRHWNTFKRGWTRRVMGNTEGAQDWDYGVIDRSVKLARGQKAPPPKKVDDGADAKADLTWWEWLFRGFW